ncbi:MAG: hypothetical protein ABSA66_14660 [Roseiarcus sp.]|jgi:hypothetical protein
MRRFDPPAPLLCVEPSADVAAAGPAGDAVSDLLDAEIDSLTIAYVARAQPAFDLLKQAEGQLAGLLVLAAAGSRSAAPDHPMLAAARAAFKEGLELLRLSHPSPRGRHHHHHLTEAATLIALALDHVEVGLRWLGEGTRDTEPSIGPLKAAHRHLQWAAGTLPGFEIVAFEQGCCAAHPAVQGITKQRRTIECKQQ